MSTPVVRMNGQRIASAQDVAGAYRRYFLRLSLADAGGKLLSNNFYWLSTQEDVIDAGAVP